MFLLSQRLCIALLALFFGLTGLTTGIAYAQTPAEPLNAVVGADGIARGPVTNLPLPRYVSLKASEANVRRGPSLSHRIDWIFTRRDMPLLVVAEYGHWRRVVDFDGLGGWIHYSLLSGTRTVIMDADMQPLYATPSTDALQVALIETGVIGRLDECELAWCRLSAGGYRGWAPKSALWGVDDDEIYP